MNKIHSAYEGAVHVCHIPSSQQLRIQGVGLCWRHFRPLSLSLAALWTVKETQEVDTFHCQVCVATPPAAHQSVLHRWQTVGELQVLGKVTKTPPIAHR